MSETKSFPLGPEHDLRAALEHAMPAGYQLGRELGYGTFGAVYYAQYNGQDGIKEDAAVKILHAPGDRYTQRRFREEGEFLANLDHENIIGVRELGSVLHHDPAYQKPDRVPFIIMEFAPRSVEDVLKGEQLSTHTAARYMLEMTAGLSHIHNDHGDPARQRHVHHDVKPPNLLLVKNPDGSETLKIADLGLTRVSETQTGNEETEDKDRRVAGTFRYMPPEQFEGKIIRASDIYAAGAVGYQLLTGRLPIIGGTSFVSWYNVHKEQIPPPMATAGKPKNEARLIDYLQGPTDIALAKKPEDRFATMGDFHEAIRDAIARADAEAKRDQAVIDLSRTLKPLPEPAPAPQSDPFGTNAGPIGTRWYTNEPFPPQPPRGFTHQYTKSAPEPAPYRLMRQMDPTVSDLLDEFDGAEPPQKSGFARRTFLTLAGVGLTSVAIWGGIEGYQALFETPGPTEPASPEQKGADYVAKNIMDALLNGQANDKDQAGLILRELARLNPAWSVKKAPGMALRYDYELGFRRRLYLEYPDGAHEELQRTMRERYDWRAIQLMGSFAAGYTPIGKIGDKGQEDRRLTAHVKFKDMSGELANMLIESQRQNDDGGSHLDERRMLWSIFSPDKPFNADNDPRQPSYGASENIDQVVQSLRERNNPGGLELIAAALAPKKPQLAISILEKLVDQALADSSTTQLWLSVATLGDAMAQYAAPRQGVIEQLQRLTDSKNQGRANAETATQLAVSVGPFEPQATTDYVLKNGGNPDAHLALLSMGDRGNAVVQTIKPKTVEENKIWFDVAVDPTNRDVADSALSALKANPAMLSRTGHVIGAALVAGRRFADFS